MWKVGDRVTFIENGNNDSTEEHGLILGESYEIIRRREVDTDDEGNIFEEDIDFEYNGYKYAVMHQGITYWIEPNSFQKLKKKKAKNECDVLDNIKENFKFGY